MALRASPLSPERRLQDKLKVKRFKMRLRCAQSRLTGKVEIPGSKSHTIRAVTIASLADGASEIHAPLHSADTRSACEAYAALGARIDTDAASWRVEGLAGRPKPPERTIDVRNSGTTLRIAMGSCSLLREGHAVLTGDEQIQRRPAGPLAESLNDLGAKVTSERGNGCPPFRVEGTLRGGETSIDAVTSQYLSSLLMCAPLAERDSTIRVPLLNEAPYVGITLDWLTRHGIRLEHADDYSEFRVPGGQSYTPVHTRIPGDFSSATFFLCAGALGDNEVLSAGLDMNDTQGDKAVVDYLQALGAEVSVSEEGVRVGAGGLQGAELDLNATPDALPMMAVVGCFARGETRLVNVPQARMKETDRISVMREELSKLGADVEELDDGLIVRESGLRGAVVDGHGDHRIVMALAVAGTLLSGETIIEGAEAMNVTYPGFADALRDLGGDIEVLETAQAPGP